MVSYQGRKILGFIITHSHTWEWLSGRKLPSNEPWQHRAVYNIWFFFFFFFNNNANTSLEQCRLHCWCFSARLFAEIFRAKAGFVFSTFCKLATFPKRGFVRLTQRRLWQTGLECGAVNWRTFISHTLSSCVALCESGKWQQASVLMAAGEGNLHCLLAPSAGKIRGWKCQKLKNKQQMCFLWTFAVFCEHLSPEANSIPYKRSSKIIHAIVGWWYLWLTAGVKDDKGELTAFLWKQFSDF